MPTCCASCSRLSGSSRFSSTNRSSARILPASRIRRRTGARARSRSSLSATSHSSSRAIENRHERVHASPAAVMRRTSWTMALICWGLVTIWTASGRSGAAMFTPACRSRRSCTAIRRTMTLKLPEKETCSHALAGTNNRLPALISASDVPGQAWILTEPSGRISVSQLSTSASSSSEPLA